MEQVKHGGKWIEFRKSVCNFNFLNKGTRCAMCNEIVPRMSSVFLVKFIKPEEEELVVHEKCVQPPAPFDKNNPFVWAAGELAKRWKEAQKWTAWV